MLSRSHRLTGRDMERLVKTGRVARSPFFTIRFIETESGPAKIAAVAPVKAFKTATRRNRMRRRVYEALRPLMGRMRDSVHAAVFASAEASDMEQQNVIRNLAGLLGKAGLLR